MWLVYYISFIFGLSKTRSIAVNLPTLTQLNQSGSHFHTPIQCNKLIERHLNMLCFSAKTRLYLHPYIRMSTASNYLSLIILLPYGIVVEPSSIRGLAADCPIHTIFKHSHFGLFHPYVVVCMALRGFQQFNRFMLLHYCKRDLYH